MAIKIIPDNCFFKVYDACDVGGVPMVYIPVYKKSMNLTSVGSGFILPRETPIGPIYLVIIPGFKPIVYGDFAHQGQSSDATFPRGTLDSLMWEEHMEIEYFDQWGMETHAWRFKRKYWLFGPWVGYLNGEKVGENSQILWQKYLLEKYDPFN